MYSQDMVQGACSDIGDLATETLAPLGLTALGGFAERHSSWQVVFHAVSSGKDGYVFVSVTEPSAVAEFVEVEVTSSRVNRETLTSSDVNRETLTSSDVNRETLAWQDHPTAAQREFLRSALLRAGRKAIGLRAMVTGA